MTFFYSMQHLVYKGRYLFLDILCLQLYFLFPFLMAITILIAFSRVILGLHYPTDVIVAALIGFIIVKFSIFVMSSFSKVTPLGVLPILLILFKSFSLFFSFFGGSMIIVISPFRLFFIFLN